MESGRGFHEGGSKCTLPVSQSSSSSSSRQKSPQVPFSCNHHPQHQQRPSWLDINYENNNEESNVHQQTELTMDSFRASGVDRSDANGSQEHHQFIVRGGWGGGGGGGGGESSGGMEVIEKEHMFDKVVTPSDVGKLNRLVIPKQQAEKYFPLDSSTNEKGLLLNFEDRNGKPWRFRYSYWKSSQSYVMTKGWSRFVKDKKLDAGDVVSFQRGLGELAKDRLFIDWRRRRLEPPHYPHQLPPPIPSFSLSSQFSLHPWSHHHHLYQYQHQHYPHLMQPNSYHGGINGGGGGGEWVGAPQNQAGMMQFQRGGVEGMGMAMPIPPSMVYESVPVVQGKVAAKKMRLFGVNMECPIMENNEHEILSSTTLTHFSSMTPSHRPNSSNNPSLSLRPYFIHQENVNIDDKGKSSMSLDLDI
ncbi:hypothetical protein Leryth_005601 [Lithospermum erythrorhizon]|nr:hypothetical protein Leryth_005601 [Lithospermum erythrorhizon]